MMTRGLASIGFLLVTLSLSGCGEGYADLRAFVKDSEKSVTRKIEQIPQVKEIPPFAYEGFDLPDPFKPRKIGTKQNEGGLLAPDQNRRKEPLEAYPLEQLKMVGTLTQSGVTFAIVKADKTLYRVKKGSYLGQNFGLITEITEAEVKLKEIVQDTAGDWTERLSVLPLLEGTGR